MIPLREMIVLCLMMAAIGWALRFVTLDDHEQRARVRVMESRINRNNAEAEMIVAEGLARIEREKTHKTDPENGPKGLKEKTHVHTGGN